MAENTPKQKPEPPAAAGDTPSDILARPYLPDRLESEMRAAQEVDRALRYRHALSVALLDIDPISTGAVRQSGVDVNRVFGYFVRRARSVQRDSDVLSYWTETVMMWLLPETDLDSAVLACERLRRASSSVVMDGIPPLTLSVGVAELEPGEDPKSLVRRAGDALLISQARGRNCVTRADVLPRPESK
jgi:GGDEF domain-containing protein